MGFAHCGHACRASSACCQQGQHARCAQGATQAAVIGDLWHTTQAAALAALSAAPMAAPALTPVLEALPPAAPAFTLALAALPRAVPALLPAPGALTPAGVAARPAGRLPAPVLCNSTICLQDESAAGWRAPKHIEEPPFRAMYSVLLLTSRSNSDDGSFSSTQC